jgi:vacuolar-type H+-ATPase subunit H
MGKKVNKICVLTWIALLLFVFSSCESKNKAEKEVQTAKEDSAANVFEARAEAREKSGKVYHDSSDIRVENSFDMSKFKGEDSVKAHAVKEQIKKQFREMYK